MRIRLILLLLILPFLQNCKERGMCLNEKDILSVRKDTKIIRLNYNQSQENLIREVESLYKEDLCWKERELGIELSDGTIIKAIFVKICPLKQEFYRPAKSEVKILMNKEGELLLNEDLRIGVDSLSNWIGLNYPNDKETEREEILILWEEQAPKEKVEELFGAIKEGYLKSYRNKSKREFGKELCDLNKEQLYKIMKELDYRINLGFGKILRPPPPPLDY